MKKLMATGKWSKAENRWNMVVALRRPPARASDPAAAIRAEPRRATVLRLRPTSEA